MSMFTAADGAMDFWLKPDTLSIKTSGFEHIVYFVLVLSGLVMFMRRFWLCLV
mgnify:FL=1